MILTGTDIPDEETVNSQIEITEKAIELKKRELKTLENRLKKLQAKGDD